MAKNDSRKKLYVIYGADEFRVAGDAKSLVESLVPEADRAMSLEIFDGRVAGGEAVAKVVRDAVGAVQTASFFGGNKTVWIRDISFLAPARRGSEDDDDDGADRGSVKGVVEKLRAALAAIPDGHSLVLSGWQIDSRFGGIVADAQKMAKKGEADVRKYEVPSKWQAADATADLLQAEAEKRGRTISRAVCAAIVARAGTTPRQVVSELDKLLLYTDGREPTEADVEQIVSPMAETEAWDLLDAFGERKLSVALPMLHRLLDAGVSGMMLVIQLQNRITDLLLVRDALDRRQGSGGGAFQWSPSLSEEEAKAVAELPERVTGSVSRPYSSRKLTGQAMKYSRVELRRARFVMNRAHERMTSIAMPAEMVLELALTEAMGKMRA